jgi:hypothetical protein
MALLEGMCYSHYENGAPAIFTSLCCPKLKGKHCRFPIPVMWFSHAFVLVIGKILASALAAIPFTIAFNDYKD